jgi:hypothetical protein
VEEKKHVITGVEGLWRTYGFEKWLELSWFQFGESVKVQISFLVLTNLDWKQQLTTGFSSFSLREKYF